MRYIYPENAGVSPFHVPTSCTPEGVSEVLMRVGLILRSFSLNVQDFFFLSWFSFTNNIYKFWTAGEGGGHFFNSSLRHLDFSLAITAESSPLHIEVNREPSVSERNSLTTKLRAL